jgi:hypothetical protein
MASLEIEVNWLLCEAAANIPKGESLSTIPVAAAASSAVKREA